MHFLTQQHSKKRAFITGAASGLGKALALELAKDGWLLGLSDINDQQLILASEEIKNAGAKVFSYTLNVADKVAYQNVAQNFLQQANGIDVLFNNAGVGDGGTFEEYSLDNWEWMIGINQMGVIYGCHFFIPAMKQQRSGHIFNTSSLAAITCPPQMGAYSMTKAAVVSISETLYIELMDFNIKVSCIQPAFFKTNVAQHAKGGKKIIKAISILVDKSGIEAHEVAQEILSRGAKGELYVILPKIARRMSLYNRLAPTRFRKVVKERFEKFLNKI
jgi:short-subunit dehydrogenase